MRSKRRLHTGQASSALHEASERFCLDGFKGVENGVEAGAGTQACRPVRL